VPSLVVPFSPAPWHLSVLKSRNLNTSTSTADRTSSLFTSLTSAMRVPLLACGLLASLVSVASATALTYKVSPNEKACFYATVDNKGAKVAFYFAVGLCTSLPLLCFRSGIRINDRHCTVVANRYKPAALSMSTTQSMHRRRR
jgi:hypothetical protein